MASLHQAIADLLPTRLEFYEAWLNPAGLRDGRIGLAPLAAVLSFLRQEGEPYRLVTARAGEYAAEWTVADLGGFHRGLIRSAPAALRVHLLLRVARGLIRSTYRGSRAAMRWRRGGGLVTIRGSIFCEVRERVEQPLCHYYAAVLTRLMHQFGIEVETSIEQCRATGAGHCQVTIRPVL
ncbi:MAG: hypothetical protein A3F70_14920 [Acidobacteria bacterium RIFCSPLOWO2_12_FULL_67_14]|nr:MAG: hypothetical protein A3F70_14920 [Acidobacteria bacterium RIFCSPLOWO2_12_FULL_67_14]